MYFSALLSITFTLLSTASAKNILLTNDDGWAATNIRALYRDLTAAGHNVVTVAPAVQFSGNGGRFVLPEKSTLEQNALFNYPALGAPAWGHEPNDMNMWYFNGSPAACVSLGLDYVIPTFFNNMTIDLIVGGPNEGTNMGERDFAISGTIGATFYAVERGYPAIAFSGGNSNNSFYKDNLDGNKKNAYNIYSKYAIEVIETLFDSEVAGQPLLPLATGLNVNFPKAGDDLQAGCYELTFRKTRFTGSSSLVYNVHYDDKAKLIAQSTMPSLAVRNCVAGNCDLPDEFTIINNGQCEGTITAFTIDVDGPSALTAQTAELFAAVIGN